MKFDDLQNKLRMKVFCMSSSTFSLLTLHRGLNNNKSNFWRPENVKKEVILLETHEVQMCTVQLVLIMVIN